MARESVFRLGESDLDVAPLEQERIFSYQVRVYDRSGDKVGEFASSIKNVRMVNLNFGYLQDGGCSDFSFTLGDISPFTISYNYRVEFCFYDQANPWYQGFITKLPEKGTDKTQTYSGYGYAKQLSWIRINEEDLAQEVADIVSDTIDYVETNTDIIKDSSKLDTPIYTMVSNIYWDRIPSNELFERLRQLAGDYEWGVDEKRDFYFRKIDTEVRESFWIGKHLDSFKGTEDPDSVRNRLYVKCGRLTDGSDYVLRIPVDPSTEPTASQTAYGLREELIVAPEFWPTFDTIDLIATGPNDPTTSPAVGAPANMRDGNPATIWDSNAGQALNQYIRIDLGAIFEHIARVVVDSSPDIAAEQFARGFEIRVATTVPLLAGDAAVVLPATVWSTDTPDVRFEPRRGQFIEVRLTTAYAAENWHVNEFEAYELDTSDIEKWALYMLAQKDTPRKKATLTIKGVNQLIENKHVIVPYKPRGKWGIYAEDGTHIDDYQVKAVKYSLTGQSFDMSAELGQLERETIPAEFKRTLQRLEEYNMSGIRKTDDLAGGTGAKPVGITRTVIGPDVIEVPMLKSNKISMHGGLVEAGEGVLSGGGHGFVVKDGGGIYRVEMGRLNGDFGITIRDAADLIWNLRGTSQNVWQEVHDEILAGNETQVDIGGLDGNIDHIYYIICRIIGNAAGAEFHLRPNADGGNNYYRQWFSASNGVRNSAEVNATSWMWLGAANANEVCFFRAVLYAPTGAIRTLLHDSLNEQTNIEPGPFYSVAQLWTNTINNIISLRIICNQANGMKTGQE